LYWNTFINSLLFEQDFFPFSRRRKKEGVNFLPLASFRNWYYPGNQNNYGEFFLSLSIYLFIHSFIHSFIYFHSVSLLYKFIHVIFCLLFNIFIIERISKSGYFILFYFILLYFIISLVIVDVILFYVCILSVDQITPCICNLLYWHINNGQDIENSYRYCALLFWQYIY